MVDIGELQPSTIGAFKKVCSEKKETLDYMLKFGSPFEKAMAKMILTAGDAKKD